LNRVVRNTFALLISNLAVFVLTFVQIKLLASYLDSTELGAYFAVLSLSALASVFVSLGLPFVVARYISKYDTLSWGRNALELMLLAWGCVLLMGVLLLVLVYFVGTPLMEHFYGRSIPPGVLLRGCLFFVFFTLQTINRSSFEGLRRMEFLLGLDCLYWVLVVALTWHFRLSLTVEKVFSIQTAAAAGGFAVSLGVVSGFLRRMKPAKGAGFRDLFPFWYGAAATGALGACFNYLDRFIVSLLLSLQATSVFGIAGKIAHSVSIALGAPLFAISPEVTRKWTLARPEVMDRDIELAMKVMLGLGTVAAGAVAVFAKEIVLLVANQDYVNVALLVLLLVAIPMKAYYGVVTTVMRAVNRIRHAVVSDVIWLASYVLLSVLLASFYGVLGFGLAQALAAGVALLYNIRVVRRHTRARLEYGRALLTVASGVIAAGVASALKWSLAPASAGTLAAAAVLYLVVFDVLYVLFRVMSRDDLERLQGLYQSPVYVRALAVALGWPRIFGRSRA